MAGWFLRIAILVRRKRGCWIMTPVRPKVSKLWGQWFLKWLKNPKESVQVVQLQPLLLSRWLLQVPYRELGFVKYAPCFVLLNHYSDSIKMYHILALSWRTWIGKGKLIQVHDWPISDTDQGWNPRKAWITQHRMLLTFRYPAVPPLLGSTKHKTLSLLLLGFPGHSSWTRNLSSFMAFSQIHACSR